MKILNIYNETFADGPGIRLSIYVSGCEHYCDGCHNPESWDFNNGTEYNEETKQLILDTIKNNKLLTGVTLSGGDPLNPKNTPDVYDLLCSLSKLNKNIWCYTGYTYEEILNNGTDEQKKCLELIDVLVDGRFDKSKRELKTFKGSSNQRFIQPKKNFSELNMYHKI